MKVKFFRVCRFPHLKGCLDISNEIIPIFLKIGIVNRFKGGIGYNCNVLGNKVEVVLVSGIVGEEDLEELFNLLVLAV